MKATCPTCGGPFELQTSIDIQRDRKHAVLDTTSRSPPAGQAGVCGYCGEFLMATTEGLRLMSVEEEHQLSPEILRVLDHVRMVAKYRPKEEEKRDAKS